jgi:hypothetical protein
MLWLSLFATLLVMTVHLTGSGQFCDPISLEIAAGNRVAYLLMFCLAGVILLLCRHLLRCEYHHRYITGIGSAQYRLYAARWRDHPLVRGNGRGV